MEYSKAAKDSATANKTTTITRIIGFRRRGFGASRNVVVRVSQWLKYPYGTLFYPLFSPSNR